MPSGLKATLIHLLLVSGQGRAPGLAGGHVPEPDGLILTPEARVLPSGLKATLVTDLWCPVRGAPRGWPVATSHSLTVLSSLPEARVCAVGAEGHAHHTSR